MIDKKITFAFSSGEEIRTQTPVYTGSTTWERRWPNTDISSLEFRHFCQCQKKEKIHIKADRKEELFAYGF